MSDAKCGAATPHGTLLEQIMDSTQPKNEREWAARREIESLRQLVDLWKTTAENQKTALTDLRQRVKELEEENFRLKAAWDAAYKQAMENGEAFLSLKQSQGEPVGIIVEQLRALASYKHDDLSIGNDAADEIESLRQRVAELEVVIKDFAQIERGMEEELAALKQQGEPFGWYWESEYEDGIVVNDHSGDYDVQPDWTPLYTSAPTIPEGWQIVPINPTNEMILAAVKGQSNRTTVPRDDELAAGMYYDMLAAAPKPEDVK